MQEQKEEKGVKKKLGDYVARILMIGFFTLIIAVFVAAVYRKLIE